MSKFAWVTLATNDAYSLGAMVLANSLKRVGTAYELVVMVTPGVSGPMKDRLKATFNLVQEVNVMDSKDQANLTLLKRPDLGITFTKLNCWRLTQYEKCVFLDADTLVVQKCDELFEREELSAAPDVGWPDCFNSGVFVYKPSNETFQKLTEFALKEGSFDGGDQGLLNSFFSDWPTKDIKKHLPFVYNTCTTAMYSYLPAFKQHGKDIKILHFIGQFKPWLVNFDSSSRKVQTPQEYAHLQDFLQLWWTIFCEQVHSQLTTDMAGLVGALAKLTLGAPRTPEQEAYETQMRKQCWESEEKVAIRREEERMHIVKKCVSAGKFPPGDPNFWNKPDNANVEFVKEKLPDGRTVMRKIISYTGIETEEVEETEQVEVDGKIVVQKKKTSEPKMKIIKKEDAKKIASNMPQETKSFLEDEILPTDKVERDEKTNTTIITRKTATGHQQKIITVDERGLTKTQVKTFYDPVEIAGEDEEEIEEFEETETTIPAMKKTTITTTKKNTKPSSTTTVTDETKTGTETKVTTDKKTSTVTVASDKSTDDKKSETVSTSSDQKDATEKVIYEIDKDGRQIQKKITVTPGQESQVTQLSKEVDKSDVSKKITTEITKTTTVTKSTGQKSMTSSDDTTIEGNENVTTVMSADGKTKTIIKKTEKPVEVTEETVPSKMTLTKNTNTSDSKNTSEQQDSTMAESSKTTTKTTTTTKTSTTTSQQVDQSKSTTDSSAKKVLMTKDGQPFEPKGEGVTTLEEVKIPGGLKKIYTTVWPDGSTYVQTKTMYDVVEVQEDGSISAQQHNIKTGTNPDGSVTTCVEEKFEGGTKYIYTTVWPNGAKRIQTRTIYDAVEVTDDEDEEGEEEEEEEVVEEVKPEPKKEEEKPKTSDSDADKKKKKKDGEDDDAKKKDEPIRLPKLTTPEPEPKVEMTEEEKRIEITRIKVLQLKKKLGITDESAPPPPKRDFTKNAKKAPKKKEEFKY